MGESKRNTANETFGQAKKLLMVQSGIKDDIIVGCFLSNWGDKFVCGGFNKEGCRWVGSCIKLSEVACTMDKSIRRACSERCWQLVNGGNKYGEKDKDKKNNKR